MLGLGEIFSSSHFSKDVSKHFMTFLRHLSSRDFFKTFQDISRRFLIRFSFKIFFFKIYIGLF